MAVAMATRRPEAARATAGRFSRLSAHGCPVPPGVERWEFMLYTPIDGLTRAHRDAQYLLTRLRYLVDQAQPGSYNRGEWDFHVAEESEGAYDFEHAVVKFQEDLDDVGEQLARAEQSWRSVREELAAVATTRNVQLPLPVLRDGGTWRAHVTGGTGSVAVPVHVHDEGTHATLIELGHRILARVRAAIQCPSGPIKVDAANVWAVVGALDSSSPDEFWFHRRLEEEYFAARRRRLGRKGRPTRAQLASDVASGLVGLQELLSKPSPQEDRAPGEPGVYDFDGWLDGLLKATVDAGLTCSRETEQALIVALELRRDTQNYALSTGDFEHFGPERVPSPEAMRRLEEAFGPVTPQTGERVKDAAVLRLYQDLLAAITSIGGSDATEKVPPAGSQPEGDVAVGAPPDPLASAHRAVVACREAIDSVLSLDRYLDFFGRDCARHYCEEITFLAWAVARARRSLSAVASDFARAGSGKQVVWGVEADSVHAAVVALGDVLLDNLHAAVESSSTENDPRSDLWDSGITNDNYYGIAEMVRVWKAQIGRRDLIERWSNGHNPGPLEAEYDRVRAAVGGLPATSDQRTTEPAAPIDGGTGEARGIGDGPESNATGPESLSTRKITRQQANARAMDLARADPDFVRNPNIRLWAKRIGCSQGLVVELPLWRETMERTGRARRQRPPAPEVVSLSEKVEAILGQDDAQLKRLIAESEADNRADPSPLENDAPDQPPRTVRESKRL